MSLKFPDPDVKYTAEQAWLVFVELSHEAVYDLEHKVEGLGRYPSVVKVVDFWDSYERYRKMLKPICKAVKKEHEAYWRLQDKDAIE